MLAQNIHETNPTPPRSRLRIVTEVREAPETAQYDEMNQEFLSSLGGLSVEEWYRQNGLSNADGLHTQGITTEDRMASLV